MQQYFVKELKDKQVVFSFDQTHHIKNVLRLKLDDEVRVVDNEAQLYVVKLTQLEPSVVGIVVRTIDSQENRPWVRVFAVMTKKEKWELMLQKAVEFGADEIVPLTSERCVVKIKASDLPKKIARWNKISLEACKQCHRSRVVEVKKPLGLAEVDQYTAVINMLAYEQASIENHIVDFLASQKVASVNLIIGPEGGFSYSEVSELLSKNYQVVSLGWRILRAESAVMYCLNTIDNWLRIKQ